jgi:hypothetical protein
MDLLEIQKLQPSVSELLHGSRAIGWSTLCELERAQLWNEIFNLDGHNLGIVDIDH